MYSRKADVPIHENGERLVSLKGYSSRIVVKPAYYENGISGAINDCFLREGAAELLKQAAKKLPEGHYFIVYDGWRPLEVQAALFKEVGDMLRSQGKSEEEVERILPNYVDLPSKNPTKPSNHLTGGSVDVTIANEEGPLDMGTGFDTFTELARTNAFEEAISERDLRIRDHRRLLVEVMESVGFRNYREEWWHFDYGNQNWGLHMKKPAFYGGVWSLEPEQ